MAFFIFRPAGTFFVSVVLLATSALAQTPLSGATSVSAGDLHACAVVNGGVKCWGYNITGQLGDGTEDDRAIAADVIGLPAGSGVTQVSAGRDHSCAVADGGVLCWGRNAEGQLGTGWVSMHLPEPVPVVGLGPGSGVTSISAGQFFTCAVAASGVLCWGGNSHGIGTPSAAPQVIVPPGSGATMVSAGYDHACAVVNGGVQCWGYGIWGQLGDGLSTSSATPVVAIPAGSGVTAVSSGYDNSCALAAGQLKCWGAGWVGQLGTGDWDNWITSPVPVDVVGLAGTPGDVSAGVGHTCAVANGGVQCWGMNFFGSLGNGFLDASVVPHPAPVAALGPGSGASSVSAGLYFTCAVVGGGVRCWGYGGLGELGHGHFESSAVPVAVVVDDPAVNTAPVLGPVNISPAAIVPVGTFITALADFTDPDAADTHTCSIVWGDGATDQPVPVASSCTASHAYGTPGVYLVTVAVSDAAGASDSGTYAYIVVYDAAAGFVTGGGWFESAPGAYRPDATLAGRAQFGFVAKYQKGRVVPEGHTELQFKAGGLAFRSSEYDWLVIAGGKAMYKGRGTVNGGGDYGFQLTALDGQVSGSDTDRIRVKIWDRVTGATVYDNQTCGSTADDADACTALAGGEIVIHAGKK